MPKVSTNLVKQLQTAGDTTIMTGVIENQKAAILFKDTDIVEIPQVFRAKGSNIYQNVYSPNISIRDGYSRGDYDYYRPDDRIPTDDKGKIAACMCLYKQSGNGIISNIVDLMGDLVVQGIDVVHRNRKKEKFAKSWFHKTVKGPNFSERFANFFCRVGNNIIKRDTGKISLKVSRKMYKGDGSVDIAELPQVVKREIPIRYTIYNPLYLEVMTPELAMFVDSSNIQFGLKLPAEIIKKINSPFTNQEKDLLKLVPTEIVNAVRRGESLIPLDADKVRAFFYKKDDWEIWATPMTYRVLTDVQTLNKMKLSDLSAIDGVLAQVRLWKIGSSKDGGPRPTQAAMNKLAQMLMNGTSGGILDIIWGDDIDVQEISSSLHNFLGETKYAPLLNAIYTGLGIPPLFTGATSQGSFTSNFLAIKTFIVRLQYIRDKLEEFWNYELQLLQKAMGWDEPAVLTFDRMTLNDEASILQIMLHMVDRGILSDEAMQEMVGAIPEIEKFRTQREYKDREKKIVQPKASPFHKPDYESSWIEKFIQMGEVTPSQVDIELKDKKPGEKTPNEIQVDLGIKGPKNTNDLGGRPNGMKDKTKRKQKVVKPQRGVSQLINNILWSTNAQESINNIVTPLYLGMVNKKNLRQLTQEEFSGLESLKFGILSNLELNEVIDEEKMNRVICEGKVAVPEFMKMLMAELIAEYKKAHNEEPNTDTIRRLQSLAYATSNFSDDLSAVS